MSIIHLVKHCCYFTLLEGMEGTEDRAEMQGRVEMEEMEGTEQSG